MKRRTVKAILCAALMALTLSMTACGGSDDASQGAEAAAEEEVEAPREEEPAEEEEEAAPEEAPEEEEEAAPEEEASEEAASEEKAESADGQTLEEYLDSTPGAKEAIEEQIAGAEDESMTVTAEVKGNDFIFNFTIKDESLIADEAASQLETGLEATASIFEEMAGQMDEVIEQKGVVAIVIRYLDPDGNVLAERSFKAQ